MDEARARTTADVLLGLAAAGAVYYIIRTPPLRRLAWRLVLTAMTGTLPAWLSGEIRQAWAASGRGRN